MTLSYFISTVGQREHVDRVRIVPPLFVGRQLHGDLRPPAAAACADGNRQILLAPDRIADRKALHRSRHARLVEDLPVRRVEDIEIAVPIADDGEPGKILYQTRMQIARAHVSTPV